MYCQILVVRMVEKKKKTCQAVVYKISTRPCGRVLQLLRVDFEQNKTCQVDVC